MKFDDEENKGVERELAQYIPKKVLEAKGIVSKED